ncbi:unnamed protein product [Orchesella dallaii]|uniref:Uncharacterized protein n=1 Tax=Orchesella dallaii TaxID=48710 RepID=A0ABP1RMZ1_9HEXA
MTRNILDVRIIEASAYKISVRLYYKFKRNPSELGSVSNRAERHRSPVDTTTGRNTSGEVTELFMMITEDNDTGLAESSPSDNTGKDISSIQTDIVNSNTEVRENLETDREIKLKPKPTKSKCEFTDPVPFNEYEQIETNNEELLEYFTMSPSTGYRAHYASSEQISSSHNLNRRGSIGIGSKSLPTLRDEFNISLESLTFGRYLIKFVKNRR